MSVCVQAVAHKHNLAQRENVLGDPIKSDNQSWTNTILDYDLALEIQM